MNPTRTIIKDLTLSEVARQNVLNNPYAVENIQVAVGLKGIPYKGDYVVTKKMVADFFGVSERAIEKLIARNKQELEKNGYVVLERDALITNEIGKNDTADGELKFGIKTQRLGVFSFRAFLNVAMLLQRSERAKEVRSLILDIVIDTINQRAGGVTKYINQRDEDFLQSLMSNADYHKDFVEALTKYVDMGRVKYMIYTNKIYRSIFKENADEYRQVLRLEAQENERDTMYSEVLDLIASYETGYASELKKASEEKGRMLTSKEADDVFAIFEAQALWVPLREKARVKMASRDFCFRDVLHDKLAQYVSSVPMEDFERYMGDTSMPIEERLTKYLLARNNDMPEEKG